jgi:hypothetical protein
LSLLIILKKKIDNFDFRLSPLFSFRKAKAIQKNNASAEKRRQQSTANKKRGKANAKAKLAQATGSLEVAAHDATKKLVSTQRELARAVATAAASSEANASSSTENKRLNDVVLGLENELLEAQEQLDEVTVGHEMNSNASARRDQQDADFTITEKVEGSDRGRQHPFKARLAMHRMLAIGVAPSMVVEALSIGGGDVFDGREPTVNFVRLMRRETRVVVCTLAAATAASPKVSARHNTRRIINCCVFK